MRLEARGNFPPGTEPFHQEINVFHPKDLARVEQLEPPLKILKSLLFQNPGTRLFGKENLRTVRQLVTRGEKIIITPNHLSHVDHFFLWAFLDNDFRDIWDNFVIVGRESLFEDPLLRYFLSAVDSIGTVSPREIKIILEELKQGGNREECRQKLHQASQINKAAKVEVERVLNEGRIVVVYAEGQRGRTGGLISIDPHIVSLLKPATYFVAGGFNDTDYFLPPDFRKKWKEFRQDFKNPQLLLTEVVRGFVKEALPRPQTAVTLTIGRPYPSPKGNAEAVAAAIGLQMAACLLGKRKGVYREKSTPGVG